jgi:hypothetical protein
VQRRKKSTARHLEDAGWALALGGIITLILLGSLVVSRFAAWGDFP